MIEVNFYNAISPRGGARRTVADVDEALLLVRHFHPFNNTLITAYVVDRQNGPHLADVDLGPIRGCPCGDEVDGRNCVLGTWSDETGWSGLVKK